MIIIDLFEKARINTATGLPSDMWSMNLENVNLDKLAEAMLSKGSIWDKYLNK
jgi:hypothetical protein